jgi:hypothetical protein
LRFLFFLLLLSNFCFSQKSNEGFLAELIQDYVSVKYPKAPLDTFIYIGVKRQKLYIIKSKQLDRVFDISTSSKGSGNKIASFQTPLGMHSIHEKIGKGAAIGTLFVNKKNTHKIVTIDTLKNYTENDEITTRLISLIGTEVNINKGGDVDTFKRGIYIHGTSNEKSIGTPSSHGCVRMKNIDVIELFKKVHENTLVFLFDN